MIFGVAFIPRGGDFQAVISFQMWLNRRDNGEKNVMLKVGLNNEFNTNPGLTPFD